ncbi:MAG: sulfatase-like hydrolase/transferase [Steroidobacteraceae bacterium]|jgi:hypothetical protein|nr:sulfatase-like hydrolase/transferase [Steroidobacteraceae bacterium]
MWVVDLSRERLLRFLGLCLAFQLVGVLTVFVKNAWLENTNTLLSIARFLGRNHTVGLSLMERLPLFRADLIWSFVAIPMLVALVSSFLPRRPALVVTLGGAFCLITFQYLELVAVSTTGQFLTWDLFIEAYRWVQVDPNSITENVSLSSFLKYLLVMAVTSTAALLAFRTKPRALHLLAGAAGAIGLVLPLAFAIAGGGSDLVHLQPARPVLAIQLKSTSPARANAFRGAPRSMLFEQYRQLARVPACQDSQPAQTAAPGRDIIFFILETAPRRSFDLAMERGWAPNLSRLSKRAYVAERHYATYPYTSDALFSLFTGRYPLNRRSFLRSSEADLSDSLPGILRGHGYRFQVYSSSPVVDYDERLFSLLGADEVFVPTSQPSGAPEVRSHVQSILGGLALSADRQRLEHRLDQDLQSLHAFLTGVTRLKVAGQPFTAAFLPQIGHAPWLDVDGARTIADRGAAAIRIQDAWLGMLLDRLDSLDELQDTLIVVVADHGIRTRNEDPDFSGGSLDAYSFHVPLIIATPDLHAPVTIDAMTSHVDLAPTLLALLGVADPALHHGIPVWCEQADRRDLFFFAGQYLGADGFRREDRFYMEHVMTGAVYWSDQLDFRMPELLTTPESDRVREHLATTRKLLSAWNTVAAPADAAAQRKPLEEGG